MNLASFVEGYQDTPEVHTFLWNKAVEHVNNTPYLKAHRDYVEQYGYGYGHRSFHALWDALVKDAPDNFKFLEIGVFQGQVISLVKLIAEQISKPCTVYGITPLGPMGDQYSTHPDIDYLSRIRRIHQDHSLPSPVIYKGPSFDPRIKRLARESGLYDIVYIDGCHDYDVVVDDIYTYSDFLKQGGFLVVDDAACDLKIPDGLIPMNFRGLPDVTKALNDTVGTCPIDYEHRFALGHNRVYQYLPKEMCGG